MADLKKDLDHSLLLQSDQKKSFKIQMPSMPGIRKPDVSTWFSRDPPPPREESSRWNCCPTMSRFQRITMFVVCVGMGILCFSLSLMYIPVLLFKARKFALLFSLGSSFFVASLCFLWGPLAFMKHVFSKERLALSAIYLSTLVGTLYCALHLQSTPFTVLCAIFQILVLIWAVIDSIPGGTTGLSFMTKMFSRTVSSTLPV